MRGEYIQLIPGMTYNISPETFTKSHQTLAVFTLEDGQIVWHLTVCCEFMSYCRRLVRLDGQVVWEKWSFPTDKFQTICSTKNLFDPFAHETHIRRFFRPRRFVRPDALYVL